MKILQALSEIVLVLIALGNVGLWVCGGYRLPRYVHWLAAISFSFGGWASYQVWLLGTSVSGILWIPFLFAGVVYVVFIVHGVGLPSVKDLEQATEEMKKAAIMTDEEEQERVQIEH